jgi:flagellar hook-associated protein 1 FlgK
MSTGISQALDSALTGLMAASQGMSTVANNTSNANTPGYSVQSVNQVEALGNPAGPPGAIGTGTDVISIRRGFDQYLYQEMVQATAANTAAQAVSASASDLATIFPIASGGQGGLNDMLNGLFGAATTVAQDPTSLPNRDAFISDAQQVVSSFQSLGAQLGGRITTTTGQITGAVAQINGLTQQIAQINNQIMTHSGPAGTATNSLLDQVDQLVQQLGAQIGISVQQGANGTIDVYVAGGMALVNGSTSYGLAVGSGPYNDGAPSIIYSENGQDLTSRISGGALGGALDTRTQLVAANETLGAIAVGLGQAVNGQQALGLDLNGQLGGPLFNLPQPSVFPATANTGSATVTATITSPQNLQAGDYAVTLTSGGWQATNLTTNQTTSLGAGPTLSLNGMTIQVSGAANVGDSFEIQPTATAASQISLATTDPNAIAAAAPYVASPGTSSGGSITDNNVGNVNITAGAPTTSGALPPGTPVIPVANFGQQLSVQFTSATTYNVLDPTSAVVTSGTFDSTTGAELAIAYPSPPAPAGEVATFQFSPGTPAVGDSFVLGPSGPGDNGNVVAMAKLQNTQLVSGQSLSDAYTRLVSDIGDRGAEAQAAGQAAQAVFSHAQASQQSVSGVNLDEEAANLVQLQQAYQASARVIAAVQSLINDLLSETQQ